MRYDFHRGQRATLRDSSGQNHDALITGYPWRELDEPPKIAQNRPLAA